MSVVQLKQEVEKIFRFGWNSKSVSDYLDVREGTLNDVLHRKNRVQQGSKSKTIRITYFRIFLEKISASGVCPTHDLVDSIPVMHHYLDEIDDPLHRKIAAYLRRTQGSHGGWALYHDGDFDLSATVKAYYALKLTGDDADAWAAFAARLGDAPLSRRARRALADITQCQ